MTRTTFKALACVLLLLGADAAGSVAFAQAVEGNGLTLRQRLDNDRQDARRKPGERSLQQTNSERETRRRLLLRQRNSAIDSQRSEPILPKNNASSVVVTQ